MKEWLDNISIHKVVCGGFDTETTGLHPVADVPFLYQCGYITTDNEGFVAEVDIEKYTALAKAFIEQWHKKAKRFPIYLGHHIIFDMHMLTNIGIDVTGFTNLSDTQYWIRAGSDAVQVSEGGESLALKDWAVRHLNKNANLWEKDLKEERTQQAKEYNAALLKSTGWKKGEFNEFFKDKINEAADLPEGVYKAWQSWRNSLPAYLRSIVTGVVSSEDIQYNYLNREKVYEYGYMDIEYTLSCYVTMYRCVSARDNFTQVQLEQEQIYPLYRMERVGFLVDSSYLHDSRVRLKTYIKQRREDLILLYGSQITCHSNDKIAQEIAKYGLSVDSTGAEPLELLVNKVKGDETYAPLVEFISTVLELRTLEKWYSTYIIKFERQLVKSNRIYTSINQVGTVSGRISCDFQQFPKAGLVSSNGEELFDPRRMVICNEEFPCIVYLDYSAQELRVQALYTYLIDNPDDNMLRAYSPWKCHTKDGITWDPEDPKIREHAYDWEWFRNEDNQPWIKTDLHGAMTKTIFPGLTEDNPKFHDLRYVGKRTNFAKNYGASYTRIREMFPEFDEETCHRIDESYYKTFPGVKAYHMMCREWANQPCMDNLYGVKYFGVNGHHLRNMLVQGSSAYMTKNRVAALDKYLIDHNLKSKFVMQIHDEVQLYWHKDDPIEYMFEIQKLMQDIDSQVPIVSDMELTTTTWKEKKEVESIDQARTICNWSRS